ncbi:hypothetical protein [Tautonia plasticadhaerens]|uniref:Uncharacterized protein n=1 Tax=Tautonia plasticadhaerens TaxID=2527974 RepID=A0A518GVU9_9BACT|nr:hypothetical protein [Tautonia plasticadhaerens]QDV32725.1 hypothetical protein ElP_05650 [Tautonia plasticadhaerens]
MIGPVARPLGAAIAAIAALAAVARPASAQGEFERMMWLVPETANAIVLVRSADLFDTPIALKDGWKTDQDAAAGPMSHLNPEAEYTVFASKVDWVGGREADWELALVSLSAPVTPEQIADAEAGTVDSADAIPVVWSPRELFYVPFGPKLIGIYSPVDRPGVLRWATAAQKRTDVVVSDYLRQAQREFQADECQFLMAFDLAYLSSPQQIKPHVAQATSVDIKVDDLDAIAETLASVRGATIRIKADAELYGWMRIDFDRSTAPLERIAKPLLNEILQGLGADIANFRDWSILVEDKAITFRGPVTTRMARRIASIIALPTNAADGSPAVPAPSADSPTTEGIAVTVPATKRYLDDVQTLLDDLEDKDDTQRQIALWCDRYADKIDHLPILGVDPEVVDFGAKISITLRNLAASAKGVKLNIAARGTTEAAQGGTGFGVGAVGYGAYGGYYGYGYGMSIEGGTSKVAMNRITRQENIKAISQQSQVWAVMKTEEANLRRTLTQRYGVEF